MPQEDNAGKTMNLDDFLDNHGSDNIQEEKTPVVEAVSEPKEDNKKDEQKTTQKQESKSNKSGKLYTEDEVNDIMSRRLARFKFEAVEHGVDERTKDLTDRLKALEDERNNAIRESEILRISKETGIDADLLNQTQLQGDALKSFANTLKEKSSSWNTKTADLENAILQGSPKEEDGTDAFYRALMGEK